MNLTPSRLLLILGSLAASPVQAIAAQPDADQLLREMSAKIAAARSFSVEAKREIDPALLEGVDLQGKARITVSVQRPNKFAARATGKSGARRFVADGRTLTLLDEEKNLYASVPMRTTLDGLVERLDNEYGFTPPLAEFALSDPYADLRRQAHTITYLGQAKSAAGLFGLGGVECHRIGLKGKVADAELWIAVSDQLPRKLVASFHQAGRPQVQIDFSTWNLAAPVTPSDFALTPPRTAERIEMWTTARMQAAVKNP